MKIITYYAYRGNGKGQIEQGIVTLDKTKKPFMVFNPTGKLYKNEKEADKDMIRLNC